MSTTINRKNSVTAALGATVAAAAVPALLFLGAGTAQAGAGAWTTTDALGVTVHVYSWGASPSGGWCTYSADPDIVPAGILPPLPVYGVPFYLQPGGNHDLWFPGIQTGTTWAVDINCAEGTDPPTLNLVY
jgi:hypothetical protein